MLACKQIKHFHFIIIIIFIIIITLFVDLVQPHLSRPFSELRPIHFSHCYHLTKSDFVFLGGVFETTDQKAPPSGPDAFSHAVVGWCLVSQQVWYEIIEWWTCWDLPCTPTVWLSGDMWLNQSGGRHGEAEPCCAAVITALATHRVPRDV